MENPKLPNFVVLYPRGGAFNKLRAGQSFLENLLQDSLDGYIQLKNCAAVKKSYVKKHIFDCLDSSGHLFMIYEGDHPDRGRLIQPSKMEAYKKIMQKLRSMKKERQASAKKLTFKSEKLEKSDCMNSDNSSTLETESCDVDFRSIVRSENGQLVDSPSSSAIDSLTHLKEVLWSQNREIECCRRLLQRKDDVIKILATLLSSTGTIDDVCLVRIVSSCASTKSNFREYMWTQG